MFARHLPKEVLLGAIFIMQIENELDIYTISDVSYENAGHDRAEEHVYLQTLPAGQYIINRLSSWSKY